MSSQKHRRFSLRENRESIETMMQRVQALAWNPFKLSEIVTLEKCLREASGQNTGLNITFDKLANEAIYVEPAKRINYFKRTKAERLNDREMLRQASERRSVIDALKEDLCYYRRLLDELNEEPDNSKQLGDMKQSVFQTKRAHETSLRYLKISYEQAFDFLKRLMVTMHEDIPDLLESIKMSNLVKQTDKLPKLHRNGVKKLIKHYDYFQKQPSYSLSLSYYSKKLMLRTLGSYLDDIKVLSEVSREIQGFFGNEIPNVKKISTEFNKYSEDLKYPFKDPPGRVTIIHDDINPSSLLVEQQLIGMRAASRVEQMEAGETDQAFEKLTMKVRALEVGYQPKESGYDDSQPLAAPEKACIADD